MNINKLLYIVFLNLLTVTSSYANETTAVYFSGNLDASSPVTVMPYQPTFDDLNEASNYFTLVTVYDSLGASHSLSLYFFKAAANAWTVRIYGISNELRGAPFSYSPILLGTAPLVFSTDGNQENPNIGVSKISPIWSNGSTAGDINIDFYSVYQTASASSINSQVTNTIRHRDSVIFSSQMADEVLQSSKCLGRTFRNSRSCDKCYNYALKKIQFLQNSKILGEFFQQAKEEIKIKRLEVCK